MLPSGNSLTCYHLFKSYYVNMLYARFTKSTIYPLSLVIYFNCVCYICFGIFQLFAVFKVARHFFCSKLVSTTELFIYFRAYMSHFISHCQAHIHRERKIGLRLVMPSSVPYVNIKYPQRQRFCNNVCFLSFLKSFNTSFLTIFVSFGHYGPRRYLIAQTWNRAAY